MKHMTEDAISQKYFVGDLGHVMNADEWLEILSLSLEDLDLDDPEDGGQGKYELEDGRKFIIFPIPSGPGIYRDNAGASYETESGSIGAIRLQDLKDIETLNEAIEDGWGCLHEFPRQIDASDCAYSESCITIYSVWFDIG